MSQKLNLINDILYRDNRPWKAEQYSEPKFKQLLNDIKPVQQKQPPLYHIEFEKPITFKRKYFLKLIDTDAATFLNEIHTAVKRSQSANHKKFQVYPALNKTLKDLLFATNQIITERDLQEDKFKLVQGKIQKGNTADEAFIFHYLKHQLIRLYLEISESYLDYRKTENLEIEDLYATFFSEVAPEPIVITPSLKIDKETISEQITVKPQETQKETFIPISDDNRPAKKGVASYHDLINNPHRFASFEEKLFLNDYITSQYAYCGKQGYKNQLAIIYHLLIEKNYFNHFNDTTKSKITTREIVKFLNHRYDVDVDKQFRSFKNKPDERANFVDSSYWLSQLPSC